MKTARVRDPRRAVRDDTHRRHRGRSGSIAERDDL